MTVMQCVEDFVEQTARRTPIYTEEIYRYVQQKLPGTDRATLNMTLQRYEKKTPDFLRYKKGIYYRTVRTPFGMAGIDEAEVIRKTYLEDGGEIIGYESGPSYMNRLGLTTQMPSWTYIVTDKARYRTEDKVRGICLLRPVIRVNRDNYRYLQFLDVLDNRMHVCAETRHRRVILRGQIDRYGLTFEKLVGYAKYYANKDVYTELAELAQGVD